MTAKKTSSKSAESSGPNAIAATTFPALRRFLRGYLHQDWQEEHDSPAGAAQQFCDDASPQERQQVALEWEVFRQRTKNLSLPALSGVLSRQLGAEWNPKAADQLDAISTVFRPFARKT